MARNRQRAKERQARRKSGKPDSARPEGAKAEAAAAPSEPDPGTDGARDEEELREQVDLQVGAPPQDLGRSDEVLDDEPDLGDDEHFDPAADQPEEDLVATTGPQGRRGGSEADHKHRPRFVQFLFAVRAELARVQWPDRQTLTTLTGVVLGFVLIAGGYLGLLDAIFSRLIQALL
ncbi:MAG: preprotein translocase subunit SecE [Thermoleophilaceae bacterium]|nr:preprotein translocase subunit SecE [Actinomycetota bacterium]